MRGSIGTYATAKNQLRHTYIVVCFLFEIQLAADRFLVEILCFGNSRSHNLSINQLVAISERSVITRAI